MYNFVFFEAIPEISMYAVVRTGGKQYRVSTGEKLRVEKLAAAVGSELVLDQVLLVGDGPALKPSVSASSELAGRWSRRAASLFASAVPVFTQATMSGSGRTIPFLPR